MKKGGVYSRTAKRPYRPAGALGGALFLDALTGDLVGDEVGGPALGVGLVEDLAQGLFQTDQLALCLKNRIRPTG